MTENNIKTYLYEYDCFNLLPKFKKGSVNMIFADPPYFLSNNGITCSSGKVASVNKGDWDKPTSLSEMHDFNRKWIRESKRVLSDNGTIFISGTYHNIYSVGMALLEEGFTILNNITWEKTNPPPNLSCRYFTHSTETIIWAKKSKKSKHKFNYSLMKSINDNKQMKDVWRGSVIKKQEKKYGYHPTQKPTYLLERIVLASTDPGDWILDPFAGSGTTCVVSAKLGRNSIGIENNKEYFEIMLKRLESEDTKSIIRRDNICGG